MDTRMHGQVASSELAEELSAVTADEAENSFRAHGVAELRAFLETPEGKQFVFDVWHRSLTMAIEKASDDIIREVVIPAMRETLREPGFRGMLLELSRGEVAKATVATILSLPTRLEKMVKRIAKRAR